MLGKKRKKISKVNQQLQDKLPDKKPLEILC